MAFPLTGLLDIFNRANEGPPPSTQWATAVIAGQQGLVVTGNQCGVDGSGGPDFGARWIYTTAPSATNWCEAYCDIDWRPAANNSVYVYARIVDPALATCCGYAIRYYTDPGHGNPGRIYIYRIDNGVLTQLATALQTFANGDGFGIEIRSSTIKLYRRTGGVWTNLLTATDATYPDEGFIGLGVGGNDANVRLDDFGGGPFPSGTPGKTGGKRMSTGDAFTSKKWGLWVQPDGPNTVKHFLGCHDTDDITEPGGASNLIRCFRADGSGEWDIIGSTHEPPDPVAVVITTPIMEAEDWLETVRCPATLYILGHKCGRVDVFDGWERGFGLNLAEPGDKVLMGLAKREEDVLSEQSFAYEARPPIHRWFKMTVVQQDTSETEALNDIVFCNAEQCASECGVAVDICTTGYAVGDAAAGSPTNTADVLYTGDKGATWAATATDPFAGGEDIISVTCFDIDDTTTRIVVAREADAVAAMEIAYSDDAGATWTLVTVGATANQGANYGGALFSLDSRHIWLVTDGGYVYFSEDGAESWSTQAPGAPTTNDLNAIWGADSDLLMAVGDSDTVIVTIDGGDTWYNGTATGGGNELLCVGYNPYGIWWVGDDGSELYYSYDDGVTWTQRTGWVGSGSGNSITDIQFYNELCGFMTYNTTGPVGHIYRTVDGGHEWFRLTNPGTNAGLNALWVCNCNLVYAVGEASGGVAVIYRAAGGKQ